ncbi:MAG: hypothetical protein A3G23_01160 [Bacteroidetes bacterium RIFCSPLOWO2_12_FULL_37_12]|nr:MAG: hypothetical protein A3G23_01160 [Bacteroidetes bacterium RIFCSPLOWO2_12_FULL_37_12]
MAYNKYKQENRFFCFIFHILYFLKFKTKTIIQINKPTIVITNASYTIKSPFIKKTTTYKPEKVPIWFCTYVTNVR